MFSPEIIARLHCYRRQPAPEIGLALERGQRPVCPYEHFVRGLLDLLVRNTSFDNAQYVAGVPRQQFLERIDVSFKHLCNDLAVAEWVCSH